MSVSFEQAAFVETALFHMGCRSSYLIGTQISITESSLMGPQYRSS